MREQTQYCDNCWKDPATLWFRWREHDLFLCEQCGSLLRRASPGVTCRGPIPAKPAVEIEDDEEIAA